MNKLLFPIAFLLFFSCNSPQKLTESLDGIPEWVKEYPISETHYTGIGIADKSTHPLDYIKIAQQNALQNLMSQIKVTISSQSVFLQMERENGYEEDFKSNIEVKAKEILEGYELVSTYTQTNEYWVYYQLSKQKYHETRNARIQEAIEESKYFLDKAVLFSTPYKDKYIYYVQALAKLEPYLSEPLLTEFDRENVYLGSEIIARFRSYVDDYQLFCLSKKISAMIGNTVSKIDIAVEYEGNRLSNIPVMAVSADLELKDFSKTTNENGVFTTSVPKIKSTQAVQKIEAGINFQEWLDEGTKSEFIQKLFKSIKTHQINIPIYVYTPTVFVSSEEKHFNVDKKESELRFAAESALTKMGFTPVGNKNDAQLIMSISADTQKGREVKNQKMFTAFLNMSIQVKDLQGRIVFSDNINKLKGIQLDFNQADLNAYQLAKDEISNSVIADFVDSFTKD
ncbi:MAG: LPP20 family lipoprotein [Flavobacteriales bacterium]|nr:LPP20 family lipoprotein [Flavobacteriales bacterium]